MASTSNSPPSPAPAPQAPATALDRFLWGAVLAGVALAVLGVVSGSSARSAANVAALFWSLLDSGPRAALYLGACVGWGMLLTWTLRRAAGRAPGTGDAPVMAVGLGVSFMLTLSHAMGTLGLFGGAHGLSGRTWALLPLVLGAAAAILPAARALHRGVDLTTLFVPMPWNARIPIVLAWVCGASVLFVAACNPPGALWASEFGGYDVLGYHLQLPKEWLAAGTLAPLPHNVYSYLPDYVEAAFMHLGAATGSQDLLTSDGTVLLSCQLLSAGFTVLAAWCVGRLTRSLALTTGVHPASASIGGAAAAAIVMLIPWMLVVGSMAYNEAAMVLLIAAASAAAVEGITPTSLLEHSPRSRELLTRAATCGWLIGVACGVKPTALFMGAPLAGILLIGWLRPRAWPLPILSAALAGTLALAPWLIRNSSAGGNPVFPQLTHLFGNAHWSPEQVARYLSAHHFTGGWTQRLMFMFLPDESDPSGARHRGLAHPQWAWFFPAALAALAGLLALAPARRLGTLLTLAAFTQLLAWLLFTHIQSRFLIPMIAAGVPALGALLAVACDQRNTSTSTAARSTPWPRWAGSLYAAILWAMVPGGAYAVHRYLLEGPPGGGPNTLLALGPGALSGSIGRATFDAMIEADRRSFLSEAGPTVYCNFTAAPDDVLYLLGDATPLYHTGKIVYNTTYDAGPLGDAIAANPQNPARWIDALLARGITRVLVNKAEIDRLSRSGWLDPAITPEAIEQSIGRFGRIERTWGDQTIVLYRLK